MFRTVMLCFGVHFILGIFIFSGLNVAKPFTAALSTTVLVLRKIVYLCCCWRPEWRDPVNKHLDELLLPEEEREAEERRKEEMEEKEEEKNKKDEAEGVEMAYHITA